MKNRFDIRADWDSEAKVWVAVSKDLPGLATEATEPEELINKLRDLIPELIELNNVAFDSAAPIDIHLHFVREEKFAVPSAA